MGKTPRTDTRVHLEPESTLESVTWDVEAARRDLKHYQASGYRHDHGCNQAFDGDGKLVPKSKGRWRGSRDRLWNPETHGEFKRAARPKVKRTRRAKQTATDDHPTVRLVDHEHAAEEARMAAYQLLCAKRELREKGGTWDAILIG